MAKCLCIIINHSISFTVVAEGAASSKLVFQIIQQLLLLEYELKSICSGILSSWVKTNKYFLSKLGQNLGQQHVHLREDKHFTLAMHGSST